MNTSILRRAYRIARDDGFEKLGNSTMNYVSNILLSKPTKVRLRAVCYRLNGHPGIGDPLRVYQVPVSDLNYCINSSVIQQSTGGFRIIDGSWDIDAIPIEDFELYTMFQERYEYNIPWEETERFQRRRRELQTHGSFGELDVDPEEQTIEKYREYLEYIDSLYQDINNTGYKKQTDLEPNSDFLNRYPQHPALGEMGVFIGRDGRIIARFGLHRACIAKLLEIDTVPVRTSARHLKWQEVRDEIATVPCSELSKEAKLHLSHPELQDLL